MPHPHLWPAIFGAVAGFALICWASYESARRWETWRPPKRWACGAVIALFGAAHLLNVYAWLIEPNMLVVRRVEIVSAEWHGAPIMIAALGDTHVAGAHVDAARMGRIVQRVNALHPDLVVLLGDYAGGHAAAEVRSGREQQEILGGIVLLGDYAGGHAAAEVRSGREQQEILGGIATFATLDAPLGVVGVLGNHDLWYNRTSITRAMEEAGVATLWNRNVEITRQGGGFIVAGLADFTTGIPDFGEALDGASGRDTIVISHSPDPFADMPEGPALMLAGHGHCGQVTIPFVGRPITPLVNPRYACHLVEEKGRTLYVTAGIGTSKIPVRFLNPPEIVLITLRGANAPPT